MSHDWQDIDQLLSTIDEETDREARVFKDTGGSGVLLDELLEADGPFPIASGIPCTFNGDQGLTWGISPGLATCYPRSLRFRRNYQACRRSDPFVLPDHCAYGRGHALFS